MGWSVSCGRRVRGHAARGVWRRWCGGRGDLPAGCQPAGAGSALSLANAAASSAAQVVCDQHDDEPHLVYLEDGEREPRQAGVLVVADVVLDAGALALAALK